MWGRTPNYHSQIMEERHNEEMLQKIKKFILSRTLGKRLRLLPLVEKNIVPLQIRKRRKVTMLMLEAIGIYEF